MGRLHPNVLKLRKQKRMRRAYLNQFNRIHVPRSSGLTSFPEHAHNLLRPKYESWGDDAFLNTIFPGVQQESSRRKFALERADEEKLIERLSQEDFCDFVTLKDNKKMQTRLTYIFNRKKTKFFFVEVWYAEAASFLRISKEYGDKDRSIFDFGNFNTGHISWQEVLPIASLELVLPRRDG